MYRAILIAAMIGVWGMPAPIAGQQKRVELRRLAVDCLTIKRGPRLLGAIVSRDGEGVVTIAVRRAWLEKTAPAFYQEQQQREADAWQKAESELPRRIEKWIEERPEDENLVFFLKGELTRLKQGEKEPADGEETTVAQFLLISVPGKRIRVVRRQDAGRRQIALVAWRENVKDVEERSALDLSRELQQREIDPAEEQVDLSDRLTGLPDDEEQWAARQAIIEYGYDRRLDFQGHGDTLFRTGQGVDAPDVSQLLSGLLKSPLSGGLEELLGGTAKNKPKPGREFDSAKKIAEAGDIRGFRVTRVAHDLVKQEVSVESRFLARMPKGDWRTLWTYVEKADAGKERPGLQERIAADPRAKQALALLDAVGGDGGAMALRIAAATMEAQQQADSKFFTFRRRYDGRTDGPPLRGGVVK